MKQPTNYNPKRFPCSVCKRITKSVQGGTKATWNGHSVDYKGVKLCDPCYNEQVKRNNEVYKLEKEFKNRLKKQ